MTVQMHFSPYDFLWNLGRQAVLNSFKNSSCTSVFVKWYYWMFLHQLLFPSQDSKTKGVFCRTALSFSQNKLSFADPSTTNPLMHWQYRTSLLTVFRTRLKNFLCTVLAKSLPNNRSVEVNLQLLFLELYNTVNASLMFCADYQCFMNL